ncbi:MAG: hypothetical protein ACREND_11110 [Gemmatimonadaceae bacterium]
MSERVSPAARRRDLVALLILAAGAATACYGYLGLHHMASDPIVRERGKQAIDRAISYTNVVDAGWIIVAVGVVAMLWSFWQNRKSANAPR